MDRDWTTLTPYEIVRVLLDAKDRARRDYINREQS